MKIQEKISTILLICVTLALATPLVSSSGYLLLGGLGLVCLLTLRNCSKKIALFVLLYVFTFVLYILTTQNVLAAVYWKNALIMLMALIATTFAFPENKNLRKYQSPQLSWFDYVYYAFSAICFIQLIKFALHNVGTWDNRMALENGTFFANYTHVDFSVVIIFLAMIGCKRGHYLTATLLGIMAWFILPSRTLKLFILLFLACFVLKKFIYKICQHKCFDKSYKWMLMLVFGILLFSAIWVFILGRFMTVVDGHQGLYDTSNFERFVTILYSGMVILQQGLFTRGVDALAEYSTLATGAISGVTLGPHNTYFSIFLFYSVLFGGTFLYGLSRLIDRTFNEKMVPFVIPYLVTGCILHDMLSGVRLIMFIIVLIVPFGKVLPEKRILLSFKESVIGFLHEAR